MATAATVLISTRPSRGQSYTNWLTRWETTIANRQPFRTGGALRGHRGDHWSFPAARWAPAERGQFDADHTTYGVTYVVVSYGTPIAWQRADGSWYVTSRRYSLTTSRHISLISRAIG